MSSEGATPGTSGFSAEELKKIQKSEREQKQFKEWVMQSSDFSEDEKSAIQYETLAEFKTYWAKAVEAKSEFDSRHEKGCGLWSKRYQSLAAIVQAFMDDFSPLVQIIKDFGAPYGGVALGTISVLFVVASNKDKTEGSLVATISGMRDRLPGLKLYQHIYDDDHELDVNLQTKIVSTYESFIDFSIAATKYYKIGGPRRFLRALTGPDPLKTQSDKIQGLIVDVRHLCEELLDKNVDTIKRLNIQQAADIKNLEAQIEQLQETNDHTRVNEVQKLLNLETFSEEQRRQEIQKYRLTLDESLDAEQFEQMRDARLGTFERSSPYRTWLESKQACLLILSGYNERSILDEDQCWLSPIALNLIAHLSFPSAPTITTPTTAPAPILAYHLLPQRRQTLIHDVLPPLLLQLLRQKRHALRDEPAHTELLTELRRYAALSPSPSPFPPLSPSLSPENASSSNEDARTSALLKIALRVVNLFEVGETVFIVVDRVDRCMYPGQGDHRRALTKALVRMVEGARCALKVLAVINGYDWRVEDIRDEFGAERAGSVVVRTERQVRVEVE